MSVMVSLDYKLIPQALLALLKAALTAPAGHDAAVWVLDMLDCQCGAGHLSYNVMSESKSPLLSSPLLSCQRILLQNSRGHKTTSLLGQQSWLLLGQQRPSAIQLSHSHSVRLTILLTLAACPNHQKGHQPM